MQLNTHHIKVVLAERGMTWAQLAHASGLSKQNVSSVIHRGTCTPRTAGKLAVGLAVSVEEIVKNEEVEPA